MMPGVVVELEGSQKIQNAIWRASAKLRELQLPARHDATEERSSDLYSLIPKCRNLRRPSF